VCLFEDRLFPQIKLNDCSGLKSTDYRRNCAKDVLKWLENVLGDTTASDYFPLVADLEIVNRAEHDGEERV
jgi:hypothetical protein